MKGRSAVLLDGERTCAELPPWGLAITEFTAKFKRWTVFKIGLGFAET